MDARVLGTHETVLAEGLRLLLEEGTGAVTHGRIAAETGIARTTIYRHWPTRADLLVASFMKGRPGVIVRSDLEPTEALVAYLRATRDSLADSPIAGVVVAVYDQLDSDPETSVVYREIREVVRADLRTIVERGISDGSIATALDVEEILAFLLGPVFYERLLGHAAASDRLIMHLVDSISQGNST